MFGVVVSVLNRYYTKLCKSLQSELTPEFLRKLPRAAGVYVFYHQDRPLYIGQSENVHRRFNAQHLSGRDDEAASSFRVKLLRSGKIKRYKEARPWIMKNCTVKLIQVTNPDDSKLFEALLVRLWRRKYKLLND